MTVPCPVCGQPGGIVMLFEVHPCERCYAAGHRVGLAEPIEQRPVEQARFEVGDVVCLTVDRSWIKTIENVGPMCEVEPSCAITRDPAVRFTSGGFDYEEAIELVTPARWRDGDMVASKADPGANWTVRIHDEESFVMKLGMPFRISTPVDSGFKIVEREGTRVIPLEHR